MRLEEASNSGHDPWRFRFVCLADSGVGTHGGEFVSPVPVTLGTKSLGGSYGELDNRGELQHFGDLCHCRSQFRHRSGGIHDLELRLVFPGHFLC